MRCDVLSSQYDFGGGSGTLGQLWRLLGEPSPAAEVAPVGETMGRFPAGGAGGAQPARHFCAAD